MAKKLAKLLMADINATSDLAEIAKLLQSKGRGNDTILAHISKKEAERLKRDGGSGTINPETGLLEFAEFDTFAPTSIDYGAFGEAPTATQITPAVPIPNTQVEPAGQAGPAEPPVALYDSGGAAIVPNTSGAAPAPSPAAGASEAQYVPYDKSFGPQIDVPGGRLPTAMTMGAGEPTVATDQTAPAAKPWYDKLSTADMLRLGLAGGLGLYGASQSKKAAEQLQQAKEEQQALAAPYKAQGQELVRAAQAGELTPAAAQSYQALQARLAQGAESRGGVGAAQAAAQAESYRQQLLQGQYDYGLKVSNIGDNIAIGAIKTGMQADQQLNQANTAFYTSLAAIGAGIPSYTSRG